MEVADLVVKFRSDGVADVTGDVQKVDGSVSGFASNATRYGGMLTAGVTLPVLAMGVGAVKAASDTEEAINKTTVVFGDAGAAVVAWSTTAATNMGIAQSAALEYSSTLGNMLVNMGFTTDEAANMSTGIVQLSADMASFNNTSPEQAFEAIRSALVGEMEPLRQFGVNLNQAKIEAEALSLGLWDGVGAMTDSAKAAAVMSLITKETALAQGDFARTSDGAANQMRILQAQFQDAAATIGAQLLPAAIQLLGWVNDAIGAFQGLSPTMQNVVLVIAGVAAAAGPLLMAFGAISMALPALGAAFTILTGPIGLVVAGMAALFIAYQTNFLGFADGVNAAVRGVTDAFNSLKAAFDEGGISGVFTAIGDALAGIDFESIGATLGEAAKTAGVALMTGLLDGIKEHGVTVVTFLAVELPIMLLTAWVNIHVWLLEAGIALMTGFLSGITGGWEGSVKPWLTDLPTNATDAIGDVTATLLLKGIELLGGLYNGALSAWDGSVVPFLAGIPGAAVGAVGDLSSALWNAGWSLMYGLKDGIAAGWNEVTDFLSGLNPADWKGPPERDRKMLIENGILTMMGYQEGLETGWKDVTRTLSGMTPVVPSGLPGGRTNAANGRGTAAGGTTFVIERGAFVGKGAWAEIQQMVGAGNARVIDRRIGAGNLAGARA